MRACVRAGGRTHSLACASTHPPANLHHPPTHLSAQMPDAPSDTASHWRPCAAASMSALAQLVDARVRFVAIA